MVYSIMPCVHPLDYATMQTRILNLYLSYYLIMFLSVTMPLIFTRQCLTCKRRVFTRFGMVGYIMKNSALYTYFYIVLYLFGERHHRSNLITARGRTFTFCLISTDTNIVNPSREIVQYRELYHRTIENWSEGAEGKLIFSHFIFPKSFKAFILKYMLFVVCC